MSVPGGTHTSATSTPRPPPARRPGLRLATEPAFASSGGDPGSIVKLSSGDVVDPRAVTTDVPLDPTPSAGTLGRSGLGAGEPLATPPIPRGDKVSSPDPALRGPRRPFRANVRTRVPPIGERPALADHPLVEVRARRAAYRHAPTVTVPIPLLATHAPGTDALGESTGRPLPARPAATIGNATLSALRGIDPMEPDARSADLQGVAVKDACSSGHIRSGNLNHGAFGDARLLVVGSNHSTLCGLHLVTEVLEQSCGVVGELLGGRDEAIEERVDAALRVVDGVKEFGTRKPRECDPDREQHYHQRCQYGLQRSSLHSRPCRALLATTEAGRCRLQVDPSLPANRTDGDAAGEGYQTTLSRLEYANPDFADLGAPRLHGESIGRGLREKAVQDSADLNGSPAPRDGRSSSPKRWSAGSASESRGRCSDRAARARRPRDYLGGGDATSASGWRTQTRGKVCVA